MDLKFQDGTVSLPTDEKAAAHFIADMFKTGGRLPNEPDKVVDWDDFVEHNITDAVASSDIRPLLSQSLEILIREPLEPLLQVTPLYNKVQVKGLHTDIIAGAVGAVTAGDVEEGGPTPEVMFNLGGGLQTAYVGKSGLAASFTDEVLRYSTWDVMGIMLRQITAALARHKEQKAVAFLRELGLQLYNNRTPTTSMFGSMSGRDENLNPNGTVRTEDLFRGMAHMAEEGFLPNVLLIHPLAYLTFLQDPIMQQMMLSHGGGGWWNMYQGNPGPRDPWSRGGVGARGDSSGNQLQASGNVSGDPATGVAGREHGIDSRFQLPGAFPFPLSIVTSPLIPFDPDTQLTDMFLLSAGNVGMYLEDEAPTRVEWRDEHREIMKFKVRERYGFGVVHEGQGVGVMKNVFVGDRNYWNSQVNVSLNAVPAFSAATAYV